jgi:rfaE bifunctional protein kinase chain/domain
MNRTRLDQVLLQLRGVRALVVGDLFLDEYLVVDRTLSETSIETGLEAYQVTSVRSAPGAVGTVVKDLCALGCAVRVIGVLGDDGNGFDLRRGLVNAGADVAGLIIEKGTLTNTYIKPLVYEMGLAPKERERFDIKNRRALSTEVENRLRGNFREVADWAHVVILSGYIETSSGGVLTDLVSEDAASFAKKRPEKPLLVDSRFLRSTIANGILKCNVREASRVAGLDASENARDDVLFSLGAGLVRLTGCPAFVTVGARGILVADTAGCRLVPGIPVEGPIDTVGAGDAALSAIGAALGAGATNDEAAVLGILAASVTIGKIGETGTATAAEIANMAAQKAATSRQNMDRTHPPER